MKKLWYESFLEIINSDITKSKMKSLPEDEHFRYSLLMNTHLFLLSNKFLEKINPKNHMVSLIELSKSEFQPLSLPFQGIWVESSDVLMEYDYENIKIQFLGALIVENEESPTPQYQIFSLIRPITGDLQINALNITKEKFESLSIHPFSKGLYEFLRRLLEGIHDKSCTSGISKINIKARVGVGSERRLLSIKKIIHITLKEDRKKYESENHIVIDWSHRWEVRGHWRTITGIGKDRFGNYNLFGMTWVKPFIKGPEEKQMISKVRIIL